MLLTGSDSHRVGKGNMPESMAPNQVGKPAYEGYLRADNATIAERLGAADCHARSADTPKSTARSRLTLTPGRGSIVPYSGLKAALVQLTSLRRSDIRTNRRGAASSRRAE